MDNQQEPRAHTPPQPRSEPAVWNLGLTLVFTGLTLIIFIIIQSIIYIFAAIPVLQERHPDGFDVARMAADESSELYGLQQHGDVVSWVAIGSGILGTLLVLLFIRFKRGSKIKNYLALRLPSLKQLGLWIGALILLSFAIEFLTTNTEEFETSFMLDVYMSNTNVVILILGVGIIGPIFEELLFRGFMYEGIARKMGGQAAVLLTSILFTLIHLQYSWSVLLLLFPLGLLLGYSRMYSKSLAVPITLHIINNIVAIALVPYYLT